jgi:acetylornithine aminotransferase
VRELCDQHNILLIFDEVQVGVGRTGCLWGYQKLGVEPDALTLAKGLGGGMPIGALAVKAGADLLQPGEHASTFGGNPLACRAGLTVAEELCRRNLPAHVTAMGALLQRQLAELAARHPSLAEGARGWGLLQGLVLRADGPAAIDVVKAAMEQGLLLVPAGANVVRFVPPLTIQPRQIREAVKRLERALLACQSTTPSAT